MKKTMIALFSLLFGLCVICVTGCAGEDAETVTDAETEDLQFDNEDEQMEDIVFGDIESDLDIGSGTGMHGDPYVIDIGMKDSGNITDYVTGTPKLYYQLPAEIDENYVVKLTVTDADVEEHVPFWVSMLVNDGTYITEAETERLEGIELIGDTIEIPFVPEARGEINVNIETNVLGQVVNYEFVVEKE